MTLVRLIQDLLRNVREWDKASQLALILALMLCLSFALAAAFVSLEWRQPALAGLVGAAIVTQVVILWGNRGLVTAYTRAQRHFIEGRYAEAKAMLEPLRDAGKANVSVLTLLGNTYRQLGMLDESEITLRAALDKESLHPFPLYGFGRTLLSKGNYHEAAIVLEKAYRAGTMVAQFDLGELHYRSGQLQQAQAYLQAIRPSLQEPYRALMADYLLYRTGVGEIPALQLIDEGLPYWQENAKRFHATPYGAALAQDIEAIQTLTEERNP